jgi:hypothetical protein
MTSDPKPAQASAAQVPAPTTKQLLYLRALAGRTGTTFTPPRTREQAGREIERLQCVRFKTRTASHNRREAKDQEHERVVYATAAHPEEIAGQGAAARWRNTPPAPDVPAPKRRGQPPRLSERKEIARYRVKSGERVLCRQRIGGCVRITDRPARPHGRAYLVERELERDGEDAIQALVNDYLAQAHALDEIPMKTGAIDREQQSAA